MHKLVVIVGPTASGKSDLGVHLARKFGGEVVSADSRQVYRGLDIGSGKITTKEMLGVPHHLLNVASLKRKFSVAQYQKLAFRAIQDIQKRGKLPILVGGTPFYVYAIVDGYVFPEVKPNPKLRSELEKFSVDKLYGKLKKLDPERAKTIEMKNPRRLIRALEIVMTTGQPVPPLLSYSVKKPWYVNAVLLLGIKRSPDELKRRIRKRLLYRVDHGMLNEVKNLHRSGLSWRRLEEFGLEYRFVAKYLQKKISKQEMVDSIQRESEDFARRQMAWFKKDPRIHWIERQKQAERLINKFFS